MLTRKLKNFYSAFKRLAKFVWITISDFKFQPVQIDVVVQVQVGE